MKASAYAKTLRLVVRAPQLRGGCQLAVVGEDKAMGQWIADKAVRMVEHNHNEWVADLNLRDFANAGTTEFKFVAWTDKGELLWETGANRRLELPMADNGQMVVRELDQAFFEIYNERLAGTLIPVFSLRTRGSFGVGDFGDLKRMVDWVAETEQRVLRWCVVSGIFSRFSCICIRSVRRPARRWPLRSSASAPPCRQPRAPPAPRQRGRAFQKPEWQR